MEPFLADLIKNPKVPKILRYLLVTMVSLFIIVVSVLVAIQSPFVLGKIFGVLVAVIFLILYIYLIRIIYKS